MSVNGITNNTVTYTPNTSTKTAAKTAEAAATDAEEAGVVYEPSSATDSSSNKITDYSSIVSSMKQELSSKNQQLQNLVDQLLSKQANKYTSLADMFKNLNVDADTIAQAKKDISEDGYWGVEQTSDRLVAMAQALSGGDSSKADELISAIQKGFEQATKAWGEDLPDICKQTIDAATEKLTNWRDGITE
jgi:septation ring formation regulator EzrA